MRALNTVPETVTLNHSHGRNVHVHFGVASKSTNYCVEFKFLLSILKNATEPNEMSRHECKCPVSNGNVKFQIKKAHGKLLKCQISKASVKSQMEMSSVESKKHR